MPKAQASLHRQIELDFIRGVALLMVLVYHYGSRDLLLTNTLWRRIQETGWAGVDLFFVLSGFLVGGLLMREWKSTGSVDAWRFLKRRAFKIWPSYYLLIFTAAALHVRPLRTFFWQNLLNVQNYFLSSLSHTWSLAVEEHFYLGIAVLLGVWAARRGSPRLLVATCLVVMLTVEVARYLAVQRGRPQLFDTHLRMDALLMGVVLAALQHFEPQLFLQMRERRMVRVALVVMVGCGLLFLQAHPDPTRSGLLITVVDYSAAAALLLLSRPGSRPRGLLYRSIARLGIFSYGIYLWHISILRPVDWVLLHTPRPLRAASSTLVPFLAATAIGVFMTKLVELPALRLRERLVPPRTPEPQIPAG